MKMKISNFENDIIISDDYVRVLEIEDRALFSNIVYSIYALCYNQDSKEYIILLEGEKELNFHKDAYFILDILNINFNDRRILSKIYLNIKNQLGLDVEVKQELEIYYRDILKIIDTALIELPFDFNYKTELDIESLLKLYDIKLYNEELSFLEKVLYLIDLISLLGLCRLIIFCNLKSYFTDSEIEEIYKHIIHNKVPALLIEGVVRGNKLESEKKIRIDLEFDDYEV